MHVSRGILEGKMRLELECGRNGGLKRELAVECASQSVARLGNRALAKWRKYALAIAFEKKISES